MGRGYRPGQIGVGRGMPKKGARQDETDEIGVGRVLAIHSRSQPLAGVHDSFVEIYENIRSIN
jgi:hypothetical protein